MHVRSSRLWLSGLCAALFLASSSDAATLRVKRDAPGPAHDGASWATAFTSVTDAAAAATAGDEMWVAEGTYAIPADVSGARVVSIPGGVSLYGGFSGSETAREERNPKARVTIIDGTIQLRDAGQTPVTVDGFTVTDGTGIPVYMGSADRYSTWGFTRGAGIYVTGGTVTLSDNTITGNRTAFLQWSTEGYSHTYASGDGGGIYVEAGTVVVRGNTISHNHAEDGGGIFAASGQATVTHNAITGNIGGGVYGATVVSNNLIAGNSGGWTGAIGGADVTIVNNTIAGNTGIHCLMVMEGSHIVNNAIVNAWQDIPTTPASLLYRKVADFRNNCVYLPGDPDVYGYYDFRGKNGNLDADPLFVNPLAGDYHLRPSSPCIDAGDDSAVLSGGTDLDGNPRIKRAHVDMGAYEAAAVLRVKHDAPGPAHDGRTWPTAFVKVSDALSTALTGDEIWVAAGTYAENITLKSGLALYGGFAGTETRRTARDHRANATILDGKHADSVVTIPATVTDAAVLDGFTIRNGLGKTLGGGGILCLGAAEIRNNLIANNRAYVGCSGDTGECTNLDGGGILCLAATATIAGNMILDNRAYQGGGIAVSNAANVRILNNVIARNNAFGAATRYTGAGGGIAVDNAMCQILNNTVTANKAQIASGIYAELGALNVTVVNNVVFNNTEPNLAWVENLRVGTGAVVHHNCVSPDQAIPVPDGNLRADPLFLDPANGDYRLREGSPAIDAGDTGLVSTGDTDLGGSKRIIGPVVDMGAYEASIYPVLADAVLALKAAGGLTTLSPAEFTRLNTVTSAPEALDTRDAIRLARKAAGVE